MASWAINNLKAHSKGEYVVITGSFTGGASSAATKTTGHGWTVAGGGSGVYTLTFTAAYATLVSFVANFGAATPGNVDTYDVVRDDYASGALPITTSEGGTPTDLAASEYLDFVAIFLKHGDA